MVLSLPIRHSVVLDLLLWLELIQMLLESLLILQVSLLKDLFFYLFDLVRVSTFATLAGDLLLTCVVEAGAHLVPSWFTRE